MACRLRAFDVFRQFYYYILCVMVFSVPAWGEPMECPDEWHLYEEGRQCFLLDASQILSWEEARATCRSYGGDLTKIPDSKTNTFIKGLLPPSCPEYWIGLHDTVTENVFQWLDEDGEGNFTYWSPNEPNNLGDEDCVFISAQDEGHWNDAVCDARLGFSCQQDAKTSHDTPTPTPEGGSTVPTDIFTSDKNWHLAFRGTAFIQKPVYHAYVQGSWDVEDGCKQTANVHLPCSSHYRSPILDNWTDIKEVAFVIYQSGVMQKFAIFDGSDTNYLTWFSAEKLKSSSWHDLKGSQQYFSISGHTPWDRRFFINHYYGGCAADIGWLVVSDSQNPNCDWERGEPFPIFLYAANDTMENWTSGRIAQADVIAVYVKYM